MNLVLYAKNSNESETKLKLIAESVSQKNNVEIFQSIDDLSNRLLTIPREECVVILAAEKRDDLSELLPIIPLFRRVKIILILPDAEPETIKIGYKLEPRFLSFMGDGFNIVKEILKKMTKKTDPVEIWEEAYK
jgi:hypothetical protein